MRMLDCSAALNKMFLLIRVWVKVLEEEKEMASALEKAQDEQSI